jgi:hypothetical protein
MLTQEASKGISFKEERRFPLTAKSGDGKRLVACGERLKLAPSPQGESREGFGEGVGTVVRAPVNSWETLLRRQLLARTSRKKTKKIKSAKKAYFCMLSRALASISFFS